MVPISLLGDTKLKTNHVALLVVYNNLNSSNFSPLISLLVASDIWQAMLGTVWIIRYHSGLTNPRGGLIREVLNMQYDSICVHQPTYTGY